MLVDMGGGTGRDIKGFRRRFPHLPGRVILQERRNVLDQAELPADVEAMEHDFFKPQPIRGKMGVVLHSHELRLSTGARAYYMHSVLHDWPDEQCCDILRNIAAAMEKGYSKILLHETLIPAQDAHWESTGEDLIMMAIFATKDRSRKQWEHLLAKVGLKIVRIWNFESGSQNIIEVDLV